MHTKDKKVILFHDVPLEANMEKLMGVSGQIADFDYAELPPLKGDAQYKLWRSSWIPFRQGVHKLCSSFDHFSVLFCFFARSTAELCTSTNTPRNSNQMRFAGRILHRSEWISLGSACLRMPAKCLQGRFLDLTPRRCRWCWEKSERSIIFNHPPQFSSFVIGRQRKADSWLAALQIWNHLVNICEYYITILYIHLFAEFCGHLQSGPVLYKGQPQTSTRD